MNKALAAKTFLPGVCVIALVLGALGGRLLWVKASVPPHLQEIASAFGSAHLFFGTPQVNHAGSQLTCIASDERRCALFLCDMATGRRRVIVESDRIGWEASLDFHAGPWSPDDQSFLYSLHNQLFLSAVDTNAASLRLPGTVDAMSDGWPNNDSIRPSRFCEMAPPSRKPPRVLVTNIRPTSPANSRNSGALVHLCNRRPTSLKAQNGQK